MYNQISSMRVCRYRISFVLVLIFLRDVALISCLKFSGLVVNSGSNSGFRLPSYNVGSVSRSQCYYYQQRIFPPFSHPIRNVVAVKASVVANNLAKNSSSDTSSEDEEKRDLSTAASFAKSPTTDLSPTSNALHNKRKPFAFGTLEKRTRRLLTLTDTSYVTGSDLEVEKGGKVKITRRTFNNLIDNWAFSGHPDIHTQVEALVQRMEDMFERNVQADEDDDEDDDDYQHKESKSASSSATPNTASSSIRSYNIQPDARTYTKAIYALAKSSAPDAGERAQSMLLKMMHLYESGLNVLAKPNAHTYAGALQAMSEDPYQAQQLLQQLVHIYEDTNDKDFQPTDRCFHEVILAFAKIGEAREAEETLNTMVSLYRSQNPMYAELRPNRVNFNAVIHGWANSGEQGAAERSEEILARMEQLYNEGLSEDAKPNVKDYNAVIDAWSKSGLEEAGDKAEQILDRMQELYDQTGDINLKPNVRSYNSAINAWAKSRTKDSPERAERLLLKLKELYDVERQLDLQPDIHSFSTVVNAWARSLAYGKAERAQKIYKYMMELYQAGNRQVRPNIVLYNSIMNACAYTNGDDMPEQRRAIEIASETFRDIEQSPFCHPDQVTYGTFLKVIATQMPAGEAREKAVEAVFRKCCKDGQVSEMVLRQFQSCATSEQCLKFLGNSGLDIVSVEVLPAEWRRNVIERKTHSYNTSLRKKAAPY